MHSVNKEHILGIVYGEVVTRVCALSSRVQHLFVYIMLHSRERLDYRLKNTYELIGTLSVEYST